MIVTSKRCFLNVLTQICDADTLLNANYYMADVRSPDGTVQLENSLRYNESGQLEAEHNMNTLPSASIGKYNINYGSGELDPSIYVTNILVGIGDAFDDPVNRFIKHLNATQNMISVYDYLFKRQLKGNGLQIVIFSEDEHIDIFVDIVCQYLAHNFGCDINFIDPLYRPNIRGVANYKGNKAFAQKNIHDIRDAQLLINFNQAITQSGGEGCISNLNVYMNSFNVEQLMYLYNLLFPDAPLPSDYYTADHVRQIIIGRVKDQIPKNPFENLFLTDDYIEALKQYETDDVDINDFDDLY